MCSFCDQRNITGKTSAPTPKSVTQLIEQAIKTKKTSASESEIAFFGGSFTAIDEDYMVQLLEAASVYVKAGIFSGIRISTRPDAIDDHVLDLLQNFNVKSIELGAQSMDDNVLQMNDRGHNSEDVCVASKLIKKYNFSLGLQMMEGLYGSSPELDMYTAKMFAKLKPDTVRIYPTVILKGTKLQTLMDEGKYVPMNFDKAVDLAAELMLFFEKCGITVIRCGLHDSDSLRANMVGGIFSPAFREICESRIFLQKLKKELSGLKTKSAVVYVNKSDVSKVIGHKKCNISEFEKLGYRINIITSLDEKVGTVKVRECNDKNEF